MPTARAHLFPKLAGRWNLWVSHDKVKQGAWSVLLSGLSQGVAVDEMIVRRDRVRRSGQPCRFKALPEGELP
jgi:hypothetical protein